MISCREKPRVRRDPCAWNVGRDLISAILLIGYTLRLLIDIGRMILRLIVEAPNGQFLADSDIQGAGSRPTPYAYAMLA